MKRLALFRQRLHLAGVRLQNRLTRWRIRRLRRQLDALHRQATALLTP